MEEKDNPRSKQYDHSWDDNDDFDEGDDFDENEEECDDDAEDSLDRKMEQWDKRNWPQWLKQNVTLPFTATREEGMDENPFMSSHNKPFAVGTQMIVFALENDGGDEEIMTHVKQGSQKGFVPLADLEVTPKSDPNYWAVREYVVWFANR